LIWNTMAAPYIFHSRRNYKVLHRGDDGRSLTHVQYKAIWNCHDESPCITDIS
jgi:hypothetical protein